MAIKLHMKKQVEVKNNVRLFAENAMCGRRVNILGMAQSFSEFIHSDMEKCRFCSKKVQGALNEMDWIEAFVIECPVEELGV